MVVLQSGLPKSGNYWLYKILQETLRHGGVAHRSFVQSKPIYQEAKTWPYFADQAGIDYLEISQQGYFYRKGAFQEQIHDIDHYIDSCSHVWTHSAWIENCDAIFDKFDKIFYIVRDPRDVAISASKFLFTPFMQEQHPPAEPDPETYLKHRLYELIITWVQHVGGYLLRQKRYPIHFVFYERLLHSFDLEYSRFLKYLEIDLAPGDVRSIKEMTDFSTMKERSPYHVRKGQSGQWAGVLTQNQKRQVLKIAAPMLSLLNYPLDESQIEDTLPDLPGRLDENQVQAAIKASRGDLFDKLKYAYAFSTSQRPVSEKVSKGIEYLLGRGRWNTDT